MMNEKPFFFSNCNYELFGVLHKPTEGEMVGGYVFCHPFAEEKLWSHRVYVNIARELVNRGYAVLRFDYMGHGDSDGNFEDSNVETRLADISCAVNLLQEMLPSIAYVGLLGLRFGASLAYLTAANNPIIDELVLWDPILDGDRYMQEMLRINLTTQMTVFGEIINNRDSLVEEMKNGKLINIDGYNIGYDLYEQMTKINLVRSEHEVNAKCFIAQIGRLNQKPRKEYESFSNLIKNSQLELVHEEPFWREIKRFYSKAPNLFNSTLNWVDLNNE